MHRTISYLLCRDREYLHSTYLCDRQLVRVSPRSPSLSLHLFIPLVSFIFSRLNNAIHHNLLYLPVSRYSSAHLITRQCRPTEILFLWTPPYHPLAKAGNLVTADAKTPSLASPTLLQTPGLPPLLPKSPPDFLAGLMPLRAFSTSNSLLSYSFLRVLPHGRYGVNQYGCIMH